MTPTAAAMTSQAPGSVEITDRSILDAFTAKPDNPFLISFPRTGSHWLRMIMELYFERPSLVRAFYYPQSTTFTCVHRHDVELTIRRSNVIYLYRHPVDTVYSQLAYHRQEPDDAERIRYWATLYGRHLAKWLLADDFTTKKTVLTYEGLQKEIGGEFRKLCAHLDAPFDDAKLREAAARVSKEEVKRKTGHDAQVMQLDTAYQERRFLFKELFTPMIRETLFAQHRELERVFP